MNVTNFHNKKFLAVQFQMSMNETTCFIVKLTEKRDNFYAKHGADEKIQIVSQPNTSNTLENNNNDNCVHPKIIL